MRFSPSSGRSSTVGVPNVPSEHGPARHAAGIFGSGAVARNGRRPTGANHGYAQARLAQHLGAFVQKHDLGVVLTGTGVVTDPDVDRPTVRGPDLLFVSSARLPRPLPDGYLTVAPDLVVEIVSPSNTTTGIQEKVLEYLGAGVAAVWVVDPKARTAATYRSRTDIAILGEDEALEGGDILPGFRLPLENVLP